MKILVPSGIGDISWIYSKISNLPRDIHMKVCGEGYQRSLPYVRLLPNISSCEYVKVSSFDVKAMKQPKDYNELLEWPEDRDCPLMCNSWLERGNRIEDYLPGSPTDHYYDIDISQETREEVAKLFKDEICPIGILMASRESVESWKGWLQEEWIITLRTLVREFPFVKFVFLGAYWDVGVMKMMAPYLQMWKIPYADLVGKTDMAMTIAVLESLKVFMAFASGLNMLSIRAKKTNIMFYPEHLAGLMYSWPPVELIENKTYNAYIWDRPSNLFPKIRKVVQDSMLEAPEKLASVNMSQEFLKGQIQKVLERMESEAR